MHQKQRKDILVFILGNIQFNELISEFIHPNASHF
jgi:hypothetical protein